MDSRRIHHRSGIDICGRSLGVRRALIKRRLE